MLAYLLIICVAFSVVTASLIRLVGEYLFSQKVSDEQRMAGELAVALSEPFADRDAERLYSDVRSASESTGGRIMVLDLYGVVQADTYSEYNGTQLMRSEVAMVLSGGGEAYGFYESPESGAGSFLLPGLTVDMIGLYAAPIMVDESMAGVLVFITLAQDMYQSLMYIQTQMILWLVLNSIWFNRRRNYLIISLLTWSVLISVFLTVLLAADYNAWLIFLLGIPGQAIIVMWSRLKQSGDAFKN